MKKSGHISLLIALACFCALAQTSSDSSQAPMHQRGNRMYNTKTVEKVKGTIVSIDSIVHAGRYPGFIYLIVNTPAETTTVFIGPSWFVNEQKLKMKSGDSVQVTGARVSLEGRPVIIARQDMVGNVGIMLRDAQGVPLWRGGRGGR